MFWFILRMRSYAKKRENLLVAGSERKAEPKPWQNGCSFQSKTHPVNAALRRAVA
jgi:hypothetical protein